MTLLYRYVCKNYSSRFGHRFSKEQLPQKQNGSISIFIYHIRYLCTKVQLCVHCEPVSSVLPAFDHNNLKALVVHPYMYNIHVESRITTCTLCYSVPWRSQRIRLARRPQLIPVGSLPCRGFPSFTNSAWRVNTRRVEARSPGKDAWWQS